ncbi:MAG: helix-turn-helix domain-containing protein [Pseudomonadota bacterium]
MKHDNEAAIADEIMLTADEVARLTRKTKETLANERSRGEGLPYIKMTGKILYRSSDVLDAILAGHGGFSWNKLEASLGRYGMPSQEVKKLMAHLRRDMKG